MKPARMQKGFYWIRFEGKPVVAERVMHGSCHESETRMPGHWHVPNYNNAVNDFEVCELLSDRLTLRKVR